MTLYWWTHWFWITIFMVLTILDTIHLVGTYPLNAPYVNKDYSKDKPLKFPLAAQTDIDDVFTTDEMILSGIFRNSKIIRQKTEILGKNSDTNSAKDNIVISPLASALGEIITEQQQQQPPQQQQPEQQQQNEMKAHNDTLATSTDSMNEKLNRTKADVNLANSNSNSSLVRTPASSDDASSPVALASDTAVNLPNPVNSNMKNNINSNNISNDNVSNSSGNNKNAESQSDLKRNSSDSLSISSMPLLSASSSLDTSVDSSNDNSNPFFRKPFHFENITKEEEIIRAEIARQLDGERARKSKVLAEYRHELKFNFTADSKNLLARSAAISLDDFHQEQEDTDDDNISSEALSIQRAYILDAGAISGICFAVVGLFSGVALAGIMLYRRRYLNKPQALSEPDSSGYIDDSTIRDNSDEMYSLDNDSFLNSLEAMTIQNYWTDTVKHTKL